MKIMTVVGARPEFVQAAPVSKAIRQGHTEILVHIGQHYDDNMSEIFFTDLDIPRPDLNLNVGSGSHAEQTGQMLMRLEAVMLAQMPDWVIVYGDTNSTIAGVLATAKLHLRVAHIEAGLRSFDRRMPEEINRILTDHISTLLFAPTKAAIENLQHEGITEGVRMVGEVRVDVIQQMLGLARAQQKQLLAELNLRLNEPFALATIHRVSNTDDPVRLRGIVESLNRLDLPVVLPVHPRLQKMMQVNGLTFGANICAIEPVGFLKMIVLLDACSLVITDSGGLQKEAYILYRPTVTVRDTTEWVETVEAGWNRLCEPDPVNFASAVELARHARPASHPDFYGSYGVSQRICTSLEEHN